MYKIKTVPTLDEMLPEVRMLVEYRMAKRYLEQIIDETIKKHSLPNLNYKSVWSLEIEIREADKKLRGW